MGPGFESLKVHQKNHPRKEHEFRETLNHVGMRLHRGAQIPEGAPADRIGSQPRQSTLKSKLSPDDEDSGKRRRLETVSVINAEGPPVPIPNTEVKLCSADNTCLETSREDRSMLTQKKM